MLLLARLPFSISLSIIRVLFTFTRNSVNDLVVLLSEWSNRDNRERTSVVTAQISGGSGIDKRYLFYVFVHEEEK